MVAVGSRARPRLLVLGAGPAQVGLLRAARRRDLFVIAVDRDPGAPGFAYADKRALISTEDEADVDRLARAEDVDGIVSPGSDWPVGIAARVAHRLGLPHPLDPATAALATSKQRQRERFAAAGVPQPRALAEPAAPGFASADTGALSSSADEAAVDRLARAEDLDGIVSPGADWPVGIAARVAHRLGLPHPLDPETAALATSKQRQRERFAAAGVPHPRALAEPAVPCVVKAPDRQGQRGLALVRDAAELPAALAAAEAASRSGAVLVEELVAGPEVTVNAFSVDGVFHPLLVSDRLTAEPPAFGVALAHAWPCVPGTQAPLAAARAAAEALGVRNGPTYTQLVLAEDGPRVIELAARLGGGHDAEFVELATGYDLNGAALDAALGEPPRVPGTQSLAGGACVVFLVPPEGELRAVEGVDDALALEGIADVRIYREPGHVFGPFRRGADRAGAVLATGDSRDAALERARRAARAIRFHTR